MSDAIAVANRWIAAYNACDFDALRSLMTEDFHLEHHNRNSVFRDPAALLEVIKGFAAVAPGRRYHSIRRQLTDGRTVVTELTWEATPNVDVPGFGKRGETTRLDLACIWTVRDGRLCEYHDYG
jgi:ketosteroid isomerase-like protein